MQQTHFCCCSALLCVHNDKYKGVAFSKTFFDHHSAHHDVGALHQKSLVKAITGNKRGPGPCRHLCIISCHHSQGMGWGVGGGCRVEGGGGGGRDLVLHVYISIWKIDSFSCSPKIPI